MFTNFARFGLLVLAATAVAAVSTAVAAAASALASPKRSAASPAPSEASTPAPGFVPGPADAFVPAFHAPGEAPVEGVFQAPLDGPLTVTRGFEPPSDRYAAGHRGVDLAGAPGQTVRSAGEGTVVFAGMVGGRPLVSIEHPGGVRTTYEPVSAMVVRGQAVSRGMPIGTLRPGHPDCPVAACLHWGLRTHDKVYLDPMTLLRPVFVRLLPKE